MRTPLPAAGIIAATLEEFIDYVVFNYSISIFSNYFIAYIKWCFLVFISLLAFTPFRMQETSQQRSGEEKAAYLLAVSLLVPLCGTARSLYPVWGGTARLRKTA